MREITPIGRRGVAGSAERRMVRIPPGRAAFAMVATAACHPDGVAAKDALSG